MNTETKVPNPPAYPEIESISHGGIVEIRTLNGTGLTMLDHFAGLAMQGMLSHSNESPMSGTFINNASHEFRAEFAYEQAKAMLAERMKHL